MYRLLEWFLVTSTFIGLVVVPSLSCADVIDITIVNRSIRAYVIPNGDCGNCWSRYYWQDPSWSGSTVTAILEVSQIWPAPGEACAAVCLQAPPHEYDLGLLPQGNYTFKFRTASESFTVPAFANQEPVISGTPPTFVPSSRYSFLPIASDPDGDKLKFNIINKPSWALFNTTTGQLYGLPGNGDAGTYSNIIISASDGITTSQLPAFSITVTASTTPVPVMDGWWLIPGMIAGVGIFVRQRKGK